MSYVHDHEPYIAVPPLVDSADFQDIAASLSGLSHFQVVRTDRVPTYHLSGVDPTAARDIAYWIVNFGPDVMRQLALWGVLTYTAKKVIDGLAGEAGKDVWKAIKELLQLIHRKLARHPADKASDLRLVELRAEGRSSDGDQPGPYFSVSIMVPIPGAESLLREYVSDIESVVFSLIGCLASKVDDVRLSVDQGDHDGWGLDHKGLRARYVWH